MIMQSLCAYYDRLADSGSDAIGAEGFSSEKVHFSLVINPSGKLVQVLDVRDVKGKKTLPRNVIVPQGPKKSVNIAASFLWGNTSYVLGADEKDKPKRTTDCHEAFKEHHKTLLAKSDDKGAIAVLAFLTAWNPEDALQLSDWQDMLKSNLVFQLDGDRSFIHDRPAIRRIWLDAFGQTSGGDPGQCLISGEDAPIARLHPHIKGVDGPRRSGAALVSFNLDAFCSYGKDQNFNAPISKPKASAYTKALNHLLSSNSNRVRIADASTVFWTERESPVEGFFRNDY